MRPLENSGCLARKVYLPFIRRYIEYSYCAPGTKPVLTHFLQVLEPMDDVSLGILFRQVEEMNCTGRMRDINRDIDNLIKAVRAFI